MTRDRLLDLGLAGTGRLLDLADMSGDRALHRLRGLGHGLVRLLAQPRHLCPTGGDRTLDRAAVLTRGVRQAPESLVDLRIELGQSSFGHFVDAERESLQLRRPLARVELGLPQVLDELAQGIAPLADDLLDPAHELAVELSRALLDGGRRGRGRRLELLALPIDRRLETALVRFGVLRELLHLRSRGLTKRCAGGCHLLLERIAGTRDLFCERDARARQRLLECGALRLGRGRELLLDGAGALHRHIEPGGPRLRRRRELLLGHAGPRYLIGEGGAGTRQRLLERGGLRLRRRRELPFERFDPVDDGPR